jgi:Tol biopolymer transport system component
LLAGTLGAAGVFGGVSTAQDPRLHIRVVAADGTGGQVIGGMSAASGPAWSPDGGRIAFIGVQAAGGESDGAQIFSAAPDGGGLAQLTHLPDDDIAAIAWSPDGTRIAFASAHRSDTRLSVINADGSGWRTLAGSVNEDFPTPSWSPDGTRMTFVRGESDRSLLSVVNADGTGLKTLRRIALDTNEGGLPRWSPDGRRIAYVDARRGRFQVFTIRPDGHGRHRVGTTSCALDPVWRPDGRRLACVGIGRRGARPRFAVNVVGLGARIRRSLPRGGSRAPLAAPTWSPDGTKLTYLRLRRNGAALYVIDADGRQNRLLSARPSTLSGVPATWSPDSRRIAYGVAPPSATRAPGAADEARGAAATLPRGRRAPARARSSPTGPRRPGPVAPAP